MFGILEKNDEDDLGELGFDWMSEGRGELWSGLEEEEILWGRGLEGSNYWNCYEEGDEFRKIGI